MSGDKRPGLRATTGTCEKCSVGIRICNEKTSDILNIFIFSFLLNELEIMNQSNKKVIVISCWRGFYINNTTLSRTSILPHFRLVKTVLTAFIQNWFEKKQKYSVAFIDLTLAHDTVRRKCLLVNLYNLILFISLLCLVYFMLNNGLFKIFLYSK